MALSRGSTVAMRVSCSQESQAGFLYDAHSPRCAMPVVEGGQGVKGSPVAPSRLFSRRALMPSDSPSSSFSFWRLSALRLRASALSASVAFAICVDVIALRHPHKVTHHATWLLGGPQGFSCLRSSHAQLLDAKPSPSREACFLRSQQL